MHYLWKSIRNELKLTNGWLKPRKLIEMTGIPAAQLLNEELQRKKKEDQKRKAIEQYEQFLKKYYNNTQNISIDKRRQTKLLNIQNFNFAKDIPSTLDPVQSIPIQQLQVKSKQVFKQAISNQTLQNFDKSRNNLIYTNQSDSLTNLNSNNIYSQQNLTQDDDFESEGIYEKLLGLVKIQALIRGYLTRKKLIILKIRILKKQQNKSNQDLNLQIPHNKQNINEQRQQEEQKSQLDEIINNINWRQYFQQQELEEAYENVEIKKLEDDDDYISDGSSSNPSIDNFDMIDIYEKVYNLKPSQAYQNARQEANLIFIQEINNQQTIDQQQLLNLIDNTVVQQKQKGSASLKTKEDKLLKKQSSSVKPSKFGHKIHENKSTYQVNIVGSMSQQQDLNSTPERNLHRIDSSNQNINHNQIQQSKPRKSPYHPQFFNTGMNIDQQVLKKSNTQSPITKEEQQTSYPLTTHSIFENKINQQRQLSSNHQQRQNQQTQYPQSLTYISTQQLKMLQAQQLNQQYGKRENISQVIKDCFITKKITNQNQQQTNESSISRNPNKNLQSGKIHSINNFNSLYHNANTTNSQSFFNSKFQSNQNQQNASAYNTQSIRFINQNTKKQKAQNMVNQNIQSNHNNLNGSKSPNSQNQVKDQNERREQAQQFYMNDQQLQQHNNPTQGLQGQSHSELRNLQSNSFASNQGFQQYINADHESIYQMMRQELPGIISGQNSETASSLFMRYVKQKLVKKIKTDQMPLQIADKYIDIYKELIEKESQKRSKETNFMRNQNGLKSQSMSYNLSRNKSLAKSEQKSRAKIKTNKSNLLSNEKANVKEEQNQIDMLVSHNQSRQQSQQQILQKFSLPLQDQNDKLQINYQSVNQSHNNKPKQLQQNELSQISQEKVFYHQFNSAQDNQQQIQQQQYAIIARQHIDNDNIPTLVLNPLNNQHQLVNQSKVKFPQINNFSNTLDFKKKSRDIIKESKSIKNQYNLSRAQDTLTSFYPSYDNININNTIFHHIPGMSSNNSQQRVNQLQISFRNNQNQIQQKVPTQQHYQSYNQQYQKQIEDHKSHNISLRLQSKIPSQQSLETSIDDDMLDKIKNIYSEMRNTTKQNIQQYQKNYYQHAKNQRIGALRQQRLLSYNNNQNVKTSIETDQQQHIKQHNNNNNYYQQQLSPNKQQYNQQVNYYSANNYQKAQQINAKEQKSLHDSQSQFLVSPQKRTNQL